MTRPFDVITFDCYGTLNDALTRLSQAGYALGILSNVDDDLLAGTRQHLAVSRRWLHAAQSYFHDVTPAVAHKIPVAWINRKGEQADWLA